MKQSGHGSARPSNIKLLKQNLLQLGFFKYFRHQINGNITMTFNSTIKTGFFIAAACCFGLTAEAQQLVKKFGKEMPYEHCGSTKYEKLLQQKNPQRANNAQFEQWLAPKVAEARAKRMQKDGMDNNDVVVIPVVFHIIHNGDAIGENENIADEQILSQITVLNQDFRKMEGTNGYNENPVGADMEIEFCLAKQDEYGVYTTGIMRYNLGNEIGFEMSQVEVIKTQTQWDPEKYLNIWVFNEIFGLAGYAQFPTESGLDGLEGGSPTTANTDGVALVYNCVGSEEIYPEGSYSETRNLGRTASHEVGHFFGLRHIWGDGLGGCSGNDFCDDTPNADEPNAGCPTGFDSCEDSEGPDMIENYMDYTDDSCLNLFTADQKDRMQAVLANSPRRASLITSPGCEEGTQYENDGSLNIGGTTACNTSYAPELLLKNNGINTITTATITYQIDDLAEQTYEFTGNLATGEETTITLPSIGLEPGEHELNVAIALVNGVADQLPSNDVKSTEINTSSTFNTTEVVITIQTDEYGDETLYALVDENENIILTNASDPDWWNSDWLDSDTLYTFPAEIEQSGCYAFAIIDLAGDGICCEYGNGYYKVETAEGILIAEGGQFTQNETVYFSIDTTAGTNDANAFGSVKLYPNPANNLLNIAMDSSNMPENYTVYNSLGQVMGTGVITAATQTLTIEAYAEGVYFIKLEKGHSTQTMQFIKY